MKELAIYIHIPFCKSKCYYCDFCSFPNQLDMVDTYVEYLKKEINIYSDRMRNDYNIKTIFIGGGTPSYIDGKYIYEILSHIYKRFNISQLAEVTIESNPKTLDDKKLRIYRDLNINRISLGLQSMNDKILNEIGRIHTKNDFLKTYNKIREKGFNNVNIDIMFNLPNQTLKDVINTLEQVIELGVEHISYYSLKVEEGTPFYKQQSKGQLILPDEDTEREMYHKGINLLARNGYNHYEISNFSKDGFECGHNLFYWKLKPYIGLGLAAHSNIHNERYGNVTGLDNYISLLDKTQLPFEEKEYIDKKMKMAEYVILGLRLKKGVNKKEFFNRFDINIDNLYGEQFLKLNKQGLLELEKDNVKLTHKGFDLSNLVFIELLP